jgi:hypothetical protein
MVKAWVIKLKAKTMTFHRSIYLFQIASCLFPFLSYSKMYTTMWNIHVNFHYMVNHRNIQFHSFKIYKHLSPWPAILIRKKKYIWKDENEKGKLLDEMQFRFHFFFFFEMQFGLYLYKGIKIPIPFTEIAYIYI